MSSSPQKERNKKADHLDQMRIFAIVLLGCLLVCLAFVGFSLAISTQRAADSDRENLIRSLGITQIAIVPPGVPPRAREVVCGSGRRFSPDLPHRGDIDLSLCGDVQ